MKRTRLVGKDITLPKEFFSYINDAEIYDSSSSPEARVYFIDKDEGYYLKRSAKGTLEKESIMTDYFHKKGIGAEVVSYLYDDYDWLLTRRMPGEDATYEKFLSDPKKLCDRLAVYLRELHELDFSDCPVKNRNEAYLALADKNYKSNIYDLSLTEELFSFKSKEEAYELLSLGKKLFKSDVLLHGDYCLPNIMLNDDFGLCGYIDLGNAGVGDRHIDIFWGTWTLNFNLKTDNYRSRFLDAYGRDKINEEMIRIIAAAEVFG